MRFTFAKKTMLSHDYFPKKVDVEENTPTHPLLPLPKILGMGLTQSIFETKEVSLCQVVLRGHTWMLLAHRP